jgi:rhodanese-related sulfurtransferase/DNA-binding transcriptional ArsR family regulator
VAHRDFKRRIYPEFARIAQALASEKRLELVDLLAQAPRHVEALAEETSMSLANVSQHLQILRAAHLVEADRSGNKVIYRLCGGDVLQLWLRLRAVAERRLPEVRSVAEDFAVDGVGEAVPRSRLAAELGAGAVTLLDVRPGLEYDAGHIPGAISIPPDELAGRLNELPRGRPIVAYCRGAYCLFADDAVALLRSHGFEAYRLEGGWTEWIGERASEAEAAPGSR